MAEVCKEEQMALYGELSEKLPDYLQRAIKLKLEPTIKPEKERLLAVLRAGHENEMSGVSDPDIEFLRHSVRVFPLVRTGALYLNARKFETLNRLNLVLAKNHKSVLSGEADAELIIPKDLKKGPEELNPKVRELYTGTLPKVFGTIEKNISAR